MKPGMKAEIVLIFSKGKCFTVTLKTFPATGASFSFDSDRKCHWQFHQNDSACPGTDCIWRRKGIKQGSPGLSVTVGVDERWCLCVNILLSASMCMDYLLLSLIFKIVSSSLNRNRWCGLSAGKDKKYSLQTSYLIAEIIVIPLWVAVTGFSTRWLLLYPAGIFTLMSIAWTCMEYSDHDFCFVRLRGSCWRIHDPFSFHDGVYLLQGKSWGWLLR